MVARPVGRKEVESNPEAKGALNKEWNRLRERPMWDEDDGREKRDVAQAAREGGHDVRFGPLHGITVEKRAELVKGDKNRYFKGRVVFLGNQVKDQDDQAALFMDLGNAPATMDASRAADC